jgi:hypothetical protein
MRRTQLSKTRGRVIIALALAAGSTALATDRYWEPADGVGYWDYGPHWTPDGVPVAGDDVHIEAGGSGWTLYCTYVNPTNPLLDHLHIGNSGSGTAEAHFIQSQDSLHAVTEYVGYRGTGKHFQHGGAVTIDGALHIGYEPDSHGYYELSIGMLNAAYSYVGFGGTGAITQTGGTHQCIGLYVSNANAPGMYGEGVYNMTGGTLDADTIFLGGKATGTLFQTGGTVNATEAGLTLGVDHFGAGVYALDNGALNTYRTRVGQVGSVFTQSGGVHTIEQDLCIGFGPDGDNEARYALTDGTLTVGGNMEVGTDTGWGRYRQYAGTCVVAGAVLLAETLDAPNGKILLEGGSLDAAAVDNAGIYDQSGGSLGTGTWTNRGSFEHSGGILSAVQLDNDASTALEISGTADCRINTLNGNAGAVLLNGGLLRGRYAGGGNYFMCNFANNAHFAMSGGEFQGHFTNNGTFIYNDGTFDLATFTNYGAPGDVLLHADLTCRRVVNYGTIALDWNRTITADGTAYQNAFENNGDLLMSGRSHIVVDSASKFVNQGAMYAGGAGADYAHVEGLLENHGYLLPSFTGNDAGWLYVEGDFTSLPTAELRIRIHGTADEDYDRIAVLDTAQLAGVLDVRLTGGFVPSVGDTFALLSMGDRVGEFDTVLLPVLPADRRWRLQYRATRVYLSVIAQNLLGDMNCDGVVSPADIDPFVIALTQGQAGYEALFPNCEYLHADVNEDGTVSAADIDPFVTLLTGG